MAAASNQPWRACRRLRGAGHHLLSTSAGDLDVLRSAAGHLFPELAEHAISFDIENIRTPILSLPRIIELKQAAGRSKDLAALPMLRAVLENADPNE